MRTKDATTKHRTRRLPAVLLLAQAATLLGCSGKVEQAQGAEPSEGTRLEANAAGVDDDGDGLIGNADSYEVKPGGWLMTNAAQGVLANDRGEGTLRARVVTRPRTGWVMMWPDGSFSYIASRRTREGATISFTYRVESSTGASDESTVKIAVKNNPRAPGTPAPEEPPAEEQPPTEEPPVEEPPVEEPPVEEPSAEQPPTEQPPTTTPPTTPPPTTPSPRGGVFFSGQNPVIYVNDQPDDVYTDGYVMALASNGEIQLRGMISSGGDCHCSAGDNYPRTDTPAKRTNWINAAREAGFKNIPNNTNGTQGPSLTRPSSGKIEDTRAIGSAGTDLIISEARKASAQLPLLLIVGGPITTVADALVKDPSIADKIVVSWLAGSANLLDDWNAKADPWATEIVMTRVKSFVFPVDLDPPHVPESRMQAEWPDTKLRKLMLDSGYYRPDYDSDGQPAVPVLLPSYVKSYRQTSYASGMQLKDDPKGRVFVMTKGDSEAAGREYFRAIGKAFKK